MDIGKARKKLKLSCEDYTDEDVEEIIEFVGSLADIFIDEYLKPKDTSSGNAHRVSKLIRAPRLSTELKSNNLAKTK